MTDLAAAKFVWSVRPFKPPRDAEPIWYMGLGRFQCHMPTWDCPHCGPTAAIDVAVHECPPLVGKEMQAVFAERPVLPKSEWTHYSSRWTSIFRNAGLVVNITPGMDFPPFVWKTPTVPMRSIYKIDIQGFLLHERLKSRFYKHSITGVTWLRVIMAKVGIFAESDPIPDEVWDQCDEPEDLVDAVPSLESLESVGPYHLAGGLSSSWTTWLELQEGDVDRCQICNYVEIPQELAIERSKERSFYRKRRQLPTKYVFDWDLFLSHIFDEGLMMSSRAFGLLDEQDLEGMEVQRIEIA